VTYPDTRELVIKLQDGNLDVLGLLFDRYNLMVYRTAIGITCDADAAADLLQDVFLRLYRFADRMDIERPLEPWLYRMTVNLACTWVKRRRWIHPLEDLAEWLAGEVKNSPHHLAERREEWGAIEKALRSLPLAQRTVIVLHYIHDLSVDEIAEILDIPNGTVKSRLHYARKALKEAMSMDELGYPEALYQFT
jgi:RNA polymerase sigma-70 factor, ECF subfamily